LYLDNIIAIFNIYNDVIFTNENKIVWIHFLKFINSDIIYIMIL